jgi:hypothetical protein
MGAGAGTCTLGVVTERDADDRVGHGGRFVEGDDEIQKGLMKKTAESAGKKASGAKAKPRTLVQEALEVTWLLKGKLKSAQIAYLKIGALLAQVRDNKLFSALKHPNIEDYAQERLSLGRASLYRYVQVYDWVSESHPEWLQPKPKGFIPELTDAGDLMWIEHSLAGGKLAEKARTELEALKAKALEGKLKDGELAEWRRRGGRTSIGLKSFLSKVRLMRRRGSELKNMPAKAISLMDELIKILDNALESQDAE